MTKVCPLGAWCASSRDGEFLHYFNQTKSHKGLLVTALCGLRDGKRTRAESMGGSGRGPCPACLRKIAKS